MISRYLNFFLLSIMIFSVSCVKLKKTDAEIEREKWIEGFSDSIEFYQEKSKEIESRLATLNDQINRNLSDFELIQNPREVSGYYLLKGWKAKIPFSSTAIYARINENEKLELIATLGGSTFNKIKVGDFESETMPNDQAFNYRHDRFNTVYFAGGKADTICEYIANHLADKINLEYLENSKIKKNFQIPENEKNMISKTWHLYSAKLEALHLQKELWINSHKINAFRRIMEEEKNKINSKN